MSYLMLKLRRDSISRDNFTFFENIFDVILELCGVQASAKKLDRATTSPTRESAVDLAPFSSYSEMLASVSSSRGILIAPARFFNHDKLVVWWFGNWSAKFLYTVSLFLWMGSILAGFLLVKPSIGVGIVWVIAILVAIPGASANGNLGDGLLSQIGLLVGAGFAMAYRWDVAFGLFIGWLSWFFCSLSLAVAFRVATQAVAGSAEAFFRLLNRAKVKLIRP